jgi:hypothetical protein
MFAEDVVHTEDVEHASMGHCLEHHLATPPPQKRRATESPLANSIKAKVNLKIDGFLGSNSVTRKKKMWRHRSDQTSLQQRYMKEEYVAKLLLCKTHEDFDCGKKNHLWFEVQIPMPKKVFIC